MNLWHDMALDRANYSAAAYPCEYGFVPQTLWDDGDALDVLLLASFPIPTGILVNARPVGLMEMIDSGEQDNKIIAVPVNDKRWDTVKDLSDINPHTLQELKHFFETYKTLKGKEVVVPGFKGAADARAAFARSVQLYKDTPPSK
jgi:inorganic pyrophosphatase